MAGLCAYASVIEREYPECDLLFGPAYKGIPLVTATAIAKISSVSMNFQLLEAAGMLPQQWMQHWAEMLALTIP